MLEVPLAEPRGKARSPLEAAGVAGKILGRARAEPSLCSSPRDLPQPFPTAKASLSVGRRPRDPPPAAGGRTRTHRLTTPILILICFKRGSAMVLLATSGAGAEESEKKTQRRDCAA